MDEAKVLELAERAGLVHIGNRAFPFFISEQSDGISASDLLAFARLVAAAEREACAAICDAAAEFHGERGCVIAAIVDQNRAADIRSRTE